MAFKPKIESIKIQKTVNALYVFMLAVIAAGLIFIVSFVAIKAHETPVVYKSIHIRSNSITTSQPITYDFKYCRYAGPDVVGNITRSFVPVEKVNGSWIPSPGRAPVLIYASTHASGLLGCNTATTTVSTPIMPSGTYQLRIIGVYNVLSFLPAKVTQTNSQVVNVAESVEDAAAVQSSSYTTTTVSNNSGRTTTTSGSVNGTGNPNTAQPTK